MTEGDGFFDRPFPDDTRTIDGHPDFSGFPGEGTVSLLDAYLDAADEVDGFGTNTPIYVRFTEPIDPLLLPTPAASVGPDSPVLLVDVDPQSPTRGTTVPLQLRYNEVETPYLPSELLIALPVYGFPLRPSTTYALVLRAPIARSGAQPEFAEHPRFAEVRETLTGIGVNPDDVAYTVLFTTQDPLAEVKTIADTIHDRMDQPPFSASLSHYATYATYDFCVGEVLLPVWQHGERPYREVGGGFVFDEYGVPEVYAWERVTFGLSVPTDAEMPEGGWPVVLYSHGTGGSYMSFGGYGDDSDEAMVLGREGVAVIGVSQPLHADRATPDTDSSLDSFNYLNPVAGRTNFRQGALDQIYLAHLLATQSASFTCDGQDVLLDRTRVAYFGHSQGGLVGAMATPYMADDIVAAGFSGAGGVLGLTLQYRKDPFDIAALIASLMGMSASDIVDPFHPVVALVQTLSEVTDPINYAPAWFATDLREGPPVPVILTEGLLDAYTPYLTTEALAAAGHVPLVGAAVNDPSALRMRGLSPMSLPLTENAEAWTGAPITAGLTQYADDGHYAIYYNYDARRFYRDFLVSALNGEAWLEE